MSETDSDLLLLALSSAGFLLIKAEEKRLLRRKKRIWRKIDSHQSWTLLQAQQQTPAELRAEVVDLQNLSLVPPDQFHALEQMIAPLIRRQNTQLRECIPVRDRLMITLRFLATGETYRRLHNSLGFAVTTIGGIIPETCRALHQVLQEDYLKCPSTTSEWQQVASGFQARWDFPNCLGALGGRHLESRGPRVAVSSSQLVEFMTLVDSQHRFLYVDLGSQGRTSSGGADSDKGAVSGRTLQEALERRVASFPPPAPYPATDQSGPFTVVTDEAAPLTEYLMTPYPARGLSAPQRVFNFRLSRARQVVDNALGLLVNRFHVLRTCINLHKEKVELLVSACCALHNFLLAECRDVYMQDDIVDQEGAEREFVPGRWRADLPLLRRASLPPTTSTTRQAKKHREELCTYFNSEEGAIAFQWDKPALR